MNQASSLKTRSNSIEITKTLNRYNFEVNDF